MHVTTNNNSTDHFLSMHASFHGTGESWSRVQSQVLRQPLGDVRSMLTAGWERVFNDDQHSCSNMCGIDWLFQDQC